jgi:biopolymer transport protein ExbB/TolQ
MAVYELRGIDDTLRDILNTLKSGIATASTGPSSVTIIGDYVGLARDSTLQSILNQLRSPLSVTGSVAILRQPISVSPSGIFPVSGTVGIVADYVGLARDSSLQSILSQLRSILYVTGSVGIVNQPVSVSPSTTFPISGSIGIIADSVGLARDSSLQSILSQLRTSVVVTGAVGLLGQPLSVSPSTTFPVSGNVGIAADFVGLARDSSLQSILSQLRSYVVVTGTVNIGSSSIMVPVDIQGAAINVPINIVTDSVGLARDSTLQSILGQLRSTLSVTGTVGIVADYVGLARDSSLQSILNQLRSYVVVTGTVNIGSSSIMVPVDIQGAAINVPINIVTDSVGIARDSTAQSILSQLRSTLATTGTVGIIADYVGLARDSSLQSILNQLRTYVVVTGTVNIGSSSIMVPVDIQGAAINVPINVVTDSVGLARDSSLQSILSQLRSTLSVTGTVGIIADYVGLARDSTLQSILSQLRSYVVVTGTVNIGSSSIMVPVDIQGAAINVPINIVTDSVGLARDSTLNNMRYRLYGVNPDATGLLDTTDSNTYTVTATSWTQVQCYTFYPRYMPVKSYAFYVIAGIQGYIDTSGQTLYVRIREIRSDTTAQAFTGSTSNAWMYPSMTVFTPLNEWSGICVDAYVTSGTGYITYVWLYIHPIDTAWALTSWNTGGYTAVPLTATANNNLKIAFAEDLIGVARDSTVASTKLRGGTLNVSSITMNPNTAYTLIGSNSNRISVAVLNSGAGTLYIGPSTTSLIWPVYPGQTIVLNYINALYGQTTDTGTVVIMELAY